LSESKPKKTSVELLASGIAYTERYDSLKTERDLHLQELGAKIASVRSNLSRKIEAGDSTGDHIQDLVILHHGFEHFVEVCAAYRAFEEKLKGKKGELFLLFFRYNITDEHYLPHGWREFFRLGVLEGEDLIWNEKDGLGKSISVPVSRYVYANRPVVEANICSYGHSMDDPFKTFFGIYILSKIEGMRIPQGLAEDTHVEEIVVGDAEVSAWVAKHPFYLPEELFASARQALGNFFLRPMAENDGPPVSQPAK